MQSETMPSELNLSPPPTIPQARTYVSKQMSEYTEYNIAKGSKIRVDIPRLQRSYLMKDSYVRFRINLDINTCPANCAILFERMGAQAVFDRIEVYDYLGGTLLEQTNNIPILSCLLSDINDDLNKYTGQYAASAGMSPPICQFLNRSTAGDDNKPIVSYLTPPISGALIDETSTTLKDFVSLEVAIPVMSFLGTLSDKYVPLHNGFSVYFYLSDTSNIFIGRSKNSNDTTVTSTTVPSFSNAWISNFEYICHIIELGEQAESIVQSSQPLVIASKQFRHFQDIILGSGNQSSFRFDLNLNVVSLRNIFFTMVPVYWQNKIQFPTYSHRIRNFLENWNFQYGSSYLPEIAGISCRSSNIPISRDGTIPSVLSSEKYKGLGHNQAFMELCNTSNRSYISNIDNKSFFIDNCAEGMDYNKTSWSGSDGIIVESATLGSIVPIQGLDVDYLDANELMFIGKFAGGLNCRLSKKNTVSGIDTNGLQVSINGKFDTNNIVKMVDAYIDVFAEHDSFLQIIPGVATTVTF